MTSLLSSPHAKVLTLVLALQSVVFYAMPSNEYVPAMASLEKMNPVVGDWTMVNESRPDQETQDILKADDALTRVFTRNGETLSLFIAFFKSQRAGVVPHSPRVCLPGAGWTPDGNSYIDVKVPGRAEPININRFVVSRGENKSIVFYWFQSPHHIVASEVRSKVYLVMDSVRYRRSDTSMVRIVVPVDSRGEAHADEVGLEFVRKSFPVITAHLPS
jgi:EpsI family protein